MQFSFDTSPARVRFGRGTVRTALPPEVERLGVQRVLVVTERPHEVLARRVTEPFADAAVAWFTDVDAPGAAESATAAALRSHADGVLSIGGGAVTGTAQAVAREHHLPLVTTPTTYTSTDLAPVWAATGTRGSGQQPRAVILDPDLTDTLPRELAVASALGAVARAVESHWSAGANPVSSVLADEALTALATGLRGIGSVSLARAASPEVALIDPVATWAGTPTSAGEQLLYGAFLAASVTATTGTGLHHRLCQVLGETFRLPAAPVHAVLLPHVVRLNAPAVPAVARRIARALEVEEAAGGLRRLCVDVGAPRTLEQLGMRRKDLPEAIDRVTAALPVANPRPVGAEEVRAIVVAAFEDG